MSEEIIDKDVLIPKIVEVAKVVFPKIDVKLIRDYIEHDLIFTSNHRQYLIGNPTSNIVKWTVFLNEYIGKKLPPFVKDEFDRREGNLEKLNYLIKLFQI